MEITIVGTGYVGLVTGTCLAETGINVTCVDIDSEKIKNLNKGIVPIYEPGLDRLIEKNVQKGRLEFSTEIGNSIQQNDAIFIAVGTPPNQDGSADLQHVLKVAKAIGKNLNHYTIVITKSTVPIGTAQMVKEEIQRQLDLRKVHIGFDVASNPEFLKEGDAINDFLKPDRIVVGVESPRAKTVLEKLYKPFLLNGHPLLFMDIPSAEMTKYTANAMLATKISFINDIANLCEIVGADIDSVRKGIGSDSRIGNSFIYAGAGYGGSCFPKDVQALIKTAHASNYPLRILQAVEEVNQRQKEILFDKIMSHFDQNVKGKTIALWGLSFKPRTDDMREAPSLVIINKLLEAGAIVKAYDPAAMEEAKKYLGDQITYSNDMYGAVVDADALVLITEWSEFRMPNLDILKRLMTNRVVFDGRNIFDYEEMEEYDFAYYSIGRKKIHSPKKVLIPG
ncbi:MAG: UDP-glucose/GDP-mannose dehydrogenase family protein [Marinifilaceae bacterium]